MGPYRGGQAQYIRVPYADFNALKLPLGTEHEADFVLLAGQYLVSQIGAHLLTKLTDIFPTGMINFP